ncbi:hypothetical protein [Bdellovibrio svalbardensis]|uniref:DUF883 domain-containing protein n=1 Tax=Bdellovibrio svalbardensis TaxID=2972972 RepID=A0ABT6DLC3_9BACT|nr:hypothetical protein [Bdellovibrio svalbardensis]MDG0816875.1 hypothetical protein [Bdellovibrio svalbardensis]
MAEFTGTNKSSTSSSGASYRPTSSSSAMNLPRGEASSSKFDLKDTWANVQRRAQGAISSSEDFVKERPLRTVLGAAAVGFLAGMIARRRH